MSSLRLLPTIALALLAAPALAHAQATSRPRSSLESFFGGPSLLSALADTVAVRMTRSTCPMPVARPDTTRLERMPRALVDSAKMAPMPVARGCVADTK